MPTKKIKGSRFDQHGAGGPHGRHVTEFENDDLNDVELQQKIDGLEEDHNTFEADVARVDLQARHTKAAAPNVPLSPDEEARAIAEYSPFHECYLVERWWRDFWGKNYTGPTVGETIPHGTARVIASWINDDRHVTVWVSAMPARFYEIRCQERDGVNDQKLVTGSGEHLLAKMIAEAMINGMLSIEQIG